MVKTGCLCAIAQAATLTQHIDRKRHISIYISETCIERGDVGDRSAKSYNPYRIKLLAYFKILSQNT
jgi:hypothetical protein